MGADGPDMPEWIKERSRAVAVKLVDDRPDFFSSSSESLFCRCVYIVDVQHDTYCRSTERLWRLRYAYGIRGTLRFIREHDARIPDLHFSVPDLPIRCWETK